MPEMSFLSTLPDVLFLATAARFVLIGFVAVSTVLTASCLTLQALTVWDRRSTKSRISSGARLFLPLETPSQ